MERAQRRKAGIAAALVIAQCLAGAACQSSLGNLGGGSKPTAPARVPFVAEFKKIDAAGKGRITVDQATAYYAGLFSQLDKNGDGFLDANELEAMVPAMDARSGKELLQKLDRNSDGKLSQPEFLIIVNWLFQLASSPNELALGDVDRGS
jgi:EF-hand domain pair